MCQTSGPSSPGGVWARRLVDRSTDRPVSGPRRSGVDGSAARVTDIVQRSARQGAADTRRTAVLTRPRRRVAARGTHHRRDGLVLAGPPRKGKRKWPSPGDGRGNHSLSYERTRDAPLPHINQVVRVLDRWRRPPNSAAIATAAVADSVTRGRSPPQSGATCCGRTGAASVSQRRHGSSHAVAYATLRERVSLAAKPTQTQAAADVVGVYAASETVVGRAAIDCWCGRSDG